MADEDLSLDDVQDEPSEGEEGSGSSKKKLIIIIAIVAVLLIGGGVAAYFLIFAESETSQTSADGTVVAEDATEVVEQKEPVVKIPEKGEAIYITIPDPFLVNIVSGKRSRMMQIKVQFMVRSTESEDLVKKHLPLIRNDMLDFFSTADAKEVQTREGRSALKKGALQVARKVMKDQVGFEAIELVLFTGFVVQ